MFQQVIATDGGSPQKTATATVSITVTDANNKAPSFVQPLYNTIVDECELQQRKVFISLPDTYQPVFHCYKQWTVHSAPHGTSAALCTPG